LYAQYTDFVKWIFFFFVFFATNHTKKRHLLVMPLK